MDVPAGQLHGLVLMLFVSKLVEPRLVSKDLIGKDAIMPKDVEVVL